MTNWVKAASPVAWISLILAAGGQAVSIGYIYAKTTADIAANRYQIERNRDETLERHRNLDRTIKHLYDSMRSIYSIKTDVEVIKSQLNTIQRSVQNLEKQRAR